eukprot:5090228-Amphidinium_carterae.1
MVGYGAAVHGASGAQLLSTGHHMASNALVVTQVASTLASIYPSSPLFPRPEEKAAAVALFYCGAKVIGNRGSVVALVLLHGTAPRVGKLTLR